uniref:Uncharacterized protein MANES_05G027100 n=1 Tax=Rhizophora mucronata TaxID=61149 RepID=A0A2P2J7S7_RHIMU
MCNVLTVTTEQSMFQFDSLPSPASSPEGDSSIIATVSSS